MGIEAEAILSLLVIGVIVLLAFSFLFSILGEWLIGYNGEKDEMVRREQYKKECDEMLITQSKTHHRKCPEDFANKTKKDMDFDVDFNISLKDSVVKTEVVYAE
jgi:hypothetical protein